MPTLITLPASLRPVDGRFGPGPSKVRQDAVDALGDAAPHLLGTSHRQAAVKGQVRRVRDGLAALFTLPDGYEVALGNGGATLFWDAAVCSLIRRRSAHAVFGEFSSKFAASVAAAPFLDEPVLVESAPGTHPTLEARDDVDLYALTHCETSTGVSMPVVRPSPEGLVAVDATSGAGGLPFDPVQADAYYFSPQKCFGSDGGLWIALLSPAALDRIEELSGTRHQPAMLDLAIAVDNSRKDQTYNTPAIATLFVMAEQLDWMNANGGLAWATKECAAKAGVLYDWADAAPYATPFVTAPEMRSDVVCTIDFDDTVPAGEIAATLRANGIVDVEAYRKLGRNQLRVAVFPAVDLGDVQRLVAAIDHIVTRLGEER